MKEILMKFKVFKNLFDTLEFEEKAKEKATQAIMDVSQQYNSQCCLAVHAMGKIVRGNKDTMIFSKKTQVTNFSHNKPLYIEPKGNGITFKRALVNNSSSINAMSW